MAQKDSFTLIEAISVYIAEAGSKAKHPHTQNELHRFAHWCGPDRGIDKITTAEVVEYSERYGGNGTVPQVAQRLQVVRNFLAHMKKKGHLEQNLAQHVRIRKAPAPATQGPDANSPTIEEFTAEGHTRLASELGRLRAERAPLAEEIHRAAADKDVRENVPLEAAREQLGHVESRIRDIEAKLKSARIIDPTILRGSAVVRVGARVVLRDVETGREKHYTVVSAFEANPLEGKISDVSPVGRALVRRSAGQQVEVETPRGTQRYLIVKISV